MEPTVHHMVIAKAEGAEHGTCLRGLVCDDDTREQQIEQLLAHVLWFAADDEAETSDEDLADVLADAVRIADDLGVKWTSGR